MIIDPIFTNGITTANIPTIYQPLTLQCTATIVRGITGTVDIIWTTGDAQVRRVNNVTASSNIISASVYNDLLIIPSLNISDIGNVYECEVFVNLILPITAKTDFVIPIPGTIYFCKMFTAYILCLVYVCIYIHMYVCMYVCMHVCMYVCIYACMYICMYVHMYMCMYVLMVQLIFFNFRGMTQLKLACDTLCAAHNSDFVCCMRAIFCVLHTSKKHTS